MLSADGPLAAEVATGPAAALVALIALPLLGSAVLLLAGRRADAWGHLLGVATSAASFVVAVVVVADLLGRPAEERAVVQELFSWVPVGGFDVDVALLLDPLSAAFVLLITGVGTLVHVYSVGYLAHDPGRRRFFGFLNLFLAAMLLLVLADSFLVLYVGWEGVGLASYLLIGFWYDKPTAATAAKKAFVVNRVGDVGLGLAIMIMFATLGTVSFSGVFEGAAQEAVGQGTLAAICVLLVLAACGKSAQFPLQVWLADAMEGPTPASALIHAATMVTAGVYLITRANPLFSLSEPAQWTVMTVGIITILVGAINGCAEDDLKRVLAWSTVSQIGYMFLAAGTGPIGYAFAIFHLLTHGFFKAALFMGAGSVMHGMDDRVDMRRFGGLWRAMPLTFGVMVAGWLAIIGIPPFSGFWSKELVIKVAFERSVVLGVLALVGAGLTAYYMTRLMVMTFLGPKRWHEGAHPHESPLSMTAPMAVLAVLALVAGYLLEFPLHVEEFLEPALATTEVEDPLLSGVALAVVSTAFALVGAAVAYAQVGRRPVETEQPPAGNVLVAAARERLYSDAFYESTLERPGRYLTRALVWTDGRAVDGAVGGVAAAVGGLSGRTRRLQTGFVRSYALLVLLGAVGVVGALLLGSAL